MFFVGTRIEPVAQSSSRATGPVLPGATYQTQVVGVNVPGSDPLMLWALLDRQQYWDPHGEAETLGISAAMWPLFGLLWPSSIYLASRLALRPVCPDETILEIGCGLALASLVAHRRGARITASDCHPLAPEFLRANLQLNNLADSLEYRHGQWGPLPASLPHSSGRRPLEGRYDLIVASDVLYERDSASAVAAFIQTHAQPVAEVWIVDANRGYRPAFTRHMADYGFDLYKDARLQSRKPASPGKRPYRGRLLKYRRDASVQT